MRFEDHTKAAVFTRDDDLPSNVKHGDEGDGDNVDEVRRMN